MPTAGEARLAKKKNINERSVRKPIKKAGTSASKVNKSAQSKTQNNRILTRKHGKENIEPKNQVTKAKPAPDFSKLHDKWNSKFQKGKAVAKKANTKVSPFVLTEVETYNPLSNKSSDSSDKENTEEEEQDDFGFEIDNNALQGILNNTGIQVQQDVHPQTRNTYAGAQKNAPNTINGALTKRTSIYYTGSKKTPTNNHQPQQPKVLASNRPVFGFHAKLGKKQVVWADQDDGDDEEISFKPDASALESILNNKGIDDRQTLGVRHTMVSTRSMSFLQSYKRQSVNDNQPSKRTSIYYTGSKSKGTTSDLPRPSLIGRPRTSVIEKPTLPFGQKTALTPSLKHQYVPGSTVVGKQDDENEKKGFEINTFVKPFTPSRQETCQALKTTDVKSCLSNPLTTPCRGKLNTRSQAPSTSKKQVSWSDILTPHRGVDQVKSKDAMHIASKEQTEPANSLPSSELVDSSPWMMRATKHAAYPSTQGESPVDDGTVALKLFSDDDTQEKTEKDRKEKLELEELERQAIEELQLLEVEENRNSKEFCKGFDNNTQARLSRDISGCEPLISPLQISNTPRNLKRTDLTDQWIRATPQNHMRVTIRNKTPIASPLVRHMRTPGFLDPRCRTETVASPSPFVNPANVVRPVGRGVQAPKNYAAPKVTPVVSHTGQGVSGVSRQTENVFQGPIDTASKPNFGSQIGQRLNSGALPPGRTTAPFTPTQQVVQTPMANDPLYTGQPSFGLLSSIKKSVPEIGNKRPHSSTVAANPSFHKSLTWSDTFYSSTPGIEVTSSFQEHPNTTHNVNKNGLPTNVYQPINMPTTIRSTIPHKYNFVKPTEIPSISIPVNNYNEPVEKPLTNNYYQPAEQSFAPFNGNAFQKPEGNPWTNYHGNNFSEPAEKPITSHHGNSFYMPAEKPLVSIHSNNLSEPEEKPLTSINERSLYGGSKRDRLRLGVSGNGNVYSNGDSGHNQRSYMSGHHIASSSKTDTGPLFDSAPVTMTNPVQINGHTGSNCTYTNCLTMGKGTMVSIHSPAFIRRQPQMCSDTNFSVNPDHSFQRPGAFNATYENRGKISNTVNVPYSSRIHPNSNDSLSLRSAVGPLGFHRKELVKVQREVTTTLHRAKEETVSKENYTLAQNKSVDVRLPRSVETHNTLAQEALLDTEVALYTTLGLRIKKKCTRDLSNPLARIFEAGDSQHIVPICVCNDKIYCSVHPVLQSPTIVRRGNLKKY